MSVVSKFLLALALIVTTTLAFIFNNNPQVKPSTSITWKQQTTKWILNHNMITPQGLAFSFSEKQTPDIYSTSWFLKLSYLSSFKLSSSKDQFNWIAKQEDSNGEFRFNNNLPDLENEFLALQAIHYSGIKIKNSNDAIRYVLSLKQNNGMFGWNSKTSQGDTGATMTAIKTLQLLNYNVTSLYNDAKLRSALESAILKKVESV